MKNINYTYNLLCQVLEQYYLNGEMKHTEAFALLHLAKAFLQAYLGIDQHTAMLQSYKKGVAENIDYDYYILPDREVLEKQLQDMVRTFEFLQDAKEAARNVLIQLRPNPDLRLVDSKPRKE